MLQFYPSLISSDLVNLEKTIKMLEPYCAGFHLDVMDYHFVPNLTMGPDFVNAIRRVSHKKIWVHLMVDEPQKYIDRLMLRHGDTISIHYETVSEEMIYELAGIIHARKLLFSLALNPDTEVDVVVPYLHKNIVDQVLVMSVQPGFSGQHFLTDSYEKLHILHDLRDEHNETFGIGIDGGINHENLARVIKEGATDIALASAIFSKDNPVEALKELVQGERTTSSQ